MAVHSVCVCVCACARLAGCGLALQQSNGSQQGDCVQTLCEDLNTQYNIKGWIYVVSIG